MYLKHTWYMAAWTHEIAPGQRLHRQLLGERLVMHRTEAGLVMVAAVAAVAARGGPPQSAAALAHPVVERDGCVWIWLGDPALADASLIADAPWQDDPAWRCLPSYRHCPRANHRFMADNLLDFSRLDFMHENRVGGAGRRTPLRPKVERFEGGLRITRWQLADELPPFLQRLARFSGPVDRWQVYDWRVAGHLLSIESGNAPAGSGAPEGHVVPQALILRSLQTLTPETERSTHYHWTVARNFALDDPAISAALAGQIEAALHADRAIIEAQQRALDEYPDVPMHSLCTDASLNQARWLLDRLIAGNARPASPAVSAPLAAAALKA